MTKPETVRALQRKVERLEAQLKAMQDFMQRVYRVSAGSSQTPKFVGLVQTA